MTQFLTKQSRMRNACATFWLATSGALAPSVGLAQDGPTDTDDIVVTATRTPTAVERLPARVAVIDRQAIEAQGLITLVDALRQAPGIVAVQNGAPGSLTSVFTRGSNSKHTLALYDGVRLNDASNPNAQFNFGQDLLGDLDRVEVLRGAASSIYGSDAIGGVVNLIPRRGGDGPFQGYAEASGGSFATVRGLVGAAGTLGSFAYGATAEAYTSDGYNQVPDRFALRGGEDDGADILAVTATAEQRLSTVFSIDALLRLREASSGFDTFSGGPSFSRRADDPDLEVSEDRYTLGRIGAEARLAGGAFVTRLSGGVLDTAREERDGAAITSQAEGERRFIDLVSTWRPGDTGLFIEPALTFGAQWLDEEIDVAATAFAARIAEGESSAGAFAIAQTGLGAHLQVTGSVRRDDTDGFGEQTTYNLGLVHDLGWIGAPARLTVAHGTSFKAPSLSERFSRSAFNLGNPSLQPEEGRTTEVGFDVSPLQGEDGLGVTLGATYFESSIKNLIEYNFAQLRNINIGRVEIEGFEAYVEAKPTAQLDLEVKYTFTDANNATVPTRPQLLRRPEHVWTLLATLRPTERVDVVLDWNWVGSRTDVIYSDAGSFLASGARIDGYDVAGVTATFRVTDHLSVFGQVQNLTDELYEQPAAYAGAPRVGYVGVRSRF